MLEKEKQIYPHKLFMSPASNALAMLLGFGGGVYAESVTLGAIGYVAGGVVGYYWDRYDDIRARRRLALEDTEVSALHQSTASTEIALNSNDTGQGRTRPGM